MMKASLKPIAMIAMAFALMLPATADDAKFAVLSGIFSTVVDDDGHLTREMHDRYWSLLPEVLDEGAPKYEKFWSLIDKKVNVATHRYILSAAEECMEALLKKDTSLSAEYEQAKADFLALSDKGEDAKSLKEAVASWEGNISQIGSKKYRPNATTRNNVVAELEVQMSIARAALDRYAKLRRPAWEPTVKARKYRSMPVTLRWPGEFALTAQKQRKLTVHMLYHLSSANEQVKVVHYRMGKRPAKFYRSALRQMASGALNDYNVTGAKPEKQKWRGLLSYKVSGNGDADGVPANVFARFLPSPDGNGILGLFAISLGEGAEASGNFGRLEDAVLFE